MKVKIKIPFGQCSNWGMYQYLLPMKILILQEVMVDENMEEVEFNKKNFDVCLCPNCPVEAESNCAQIKLNPIKSTKGKIMPNSKGVPGLYCASGKAVCTDLDPDKTCQCPNCDIWKEHNLSDGNPTEYFCQNGKAVH